MANIISAQFTLAGSGARNMVTRNGNGPFDLDYNLEIVKALDAYWNDLPYLKNTVRILLDDAAGLQCFSESKDSTSCLTALLHFKDEPTIEFSFDVAIVARNTSSALDVHSGKMIHQAIEKLMKEKVVIMVSHRRDSFEQFDRVVSL